jgi:hypothetical protein
MKTYKIKIINSHGQIEIKTVEAYSRKDAEGKLGIVTILRISQVREKIK